MVQGSLEKCLPTSEVDPVKYMNRNTTQITDVNHNKLSFVQDTYAYIQKMPTCDVPAQHPALG